VNSACSTRTAPRRLIVAITGATGAVYGVRALDILRAAGHIETHLLVSAAGWLTLQHELHLAQRDLQQRADVVHSIHDVGANIASGSFAVDGMLVAPCSMKTLAAIAHGFADNLMTRAADVTLKERRRLVLLTREAPLNLAHLRNMTAITEMGGVIFPPVPAFYNRPASLDDMVDHTVTRALDLFSFSPDAPFSSAWAGLRERACV
jgi:4-hydroxy-3-polyprenylbenzoate decarboxylase